ncbi:MAG: o-succinylbenzoate synthase [candidate division Zixibacteria bacterium]|nr:o-succinylbenzoate synthase [candidate division Zixibacteria bacterium]
MKIKSVEIRPFVRRFVKPLITSFGAVSERIGFYIYVKTFNEIIGRGEISPLPSYRNESLGKTEKLLRTFSNTLPGTELDNEVEPISDFCAKISQDNSYLQFGIESALYDAASRVEGFPLCRWLNLKSKMTVPVNCLLTLPIENIEQTASDINSRGYQAVKIKVGCQNINDEIEGVKQLSQHLNNAISIRLDANKGWNYEESLKALKELSDCPIEYLEEPGCQSVEQIQSLRDETGVGIALDESLGSLEKCLLAAESDLCDVIILKPAVLGGLANTIKAYNKITELGKKVVVTSMLETEIGLASQLHVCASLSETLPPCGLDTLNLFEKPEARLSSVNNGAIQLPNGYGIGYDK